MEEEIVKVINIRTNESITTVKDLKKYIGDLRDSLVTLDKESEEYKETVDALVKSQQKLTEVQTAGKKAYSAMDDSIKGLRLQLKSLQNTYDELSAADRNGAVGKNLLVQIQGVDKELKELEASTGRWQRQVGSYQQALQALNGTYATQRQELAALKQALDNLDPSTQEYAEAFQRASEITHNLAERQELLKYSSADLGDQISNIRGIATNMVAGFSAVNAAMGLFGKESEDVQKAMLKVQQAMAIVQGMQGLDGFLKRTQGLSAAMRDWLKTTNAQTTALKAETTATNVQTAATTKATVATKGLNAALKSNPIGAIIIAVTALVSAIKPLMNLFDKLSGKFDSLNSSVKASKESFEQLNTEITNLDSEHNLEKILMQASGLSQIVIYQSDLKNEQEKLNKTTKEYNKELSTIRDNIRLYGKNNTITTGTLKELGYEQDKINDLVKTGELNIVQSDKVLKNFTKNEGFKTMLDQALSLKDAIKDINTNIKTLNTEITGEEIKGAIKTEEERKQAAEKAAQKRLEIEKKYQSEIQNIYDNSVKSTVEAYKDVLKTFKDELTIRIRTEKDPNTKKVIKETLSEINAELSKLPALIKPEDIQSTLKLLQKDWQAKLNDAIANSGKESKMKVHDEIVKLFEKTIQPDINEELAKIRRDTDWNLLELDKPIDIDLLGTVSLKDNELAKVNVQFDSLNKELEAQLYHYQQIKKFVEENNLTPSKEYEEARKKLEELSLQQAKADSDRKKALSSITTKYFNEEVATVKAYSDATVKAIEMSFEQAGIKDSFSKFLHPVSPDDEKKYLDDIYNAQLQGLTKIKEMWENRAKDMSLTNEERVEAQKNAAQAEIDIQDLTLEHEIKTAQQREELINRWVDQMTNAVGVIGDLFGSIADYYMDDIETRKRHNELTDKQAEDEFNKTVKPFQIAQATVSMIQGMVSAFAGAMQLGPIAGPPVGFALASAVLGMGLMNIQKIKNTEYNKSGSSTAPVQAPQINELPVTYTQNITNESDIDNLRNAIQSANISVSVSDINDAQNRVKVRDNNSSF